MAQARLGSTYEGLKHELIVIVAERVDSLGSTYEGLKLAEWNVPKVGTIQFRLYL